MATIAALTENFEGGANGVALDETNCFFDNVNNVDSPTFSTAQAVEGTRSALWVNQNICEADITAETTLWVSFYIYLTATATSNTAIFNAFGNSAANKILDIRVLAGTSQLQLRSVNTSRWTSTDLTTGAWHRIEVGMTVDSTCQLRIFSGANLHSTTASQDSGSQSNTNTTATNVDNVRWGLITSDATLDFYLDRVRGDNATAPAPHSTSTDGNVTSPAATASFSAPVPVVSDGNTSIPELTEDFEGAAGGTTVTTGNTFFDNVNATNAPVFSTTQALQGTRSCFWTNSNVCEANLPAETTLWVSFYVYLTANATSNTAIFNAWGNSAVNKIGDLQVVAGTSQLRLRSDSTTRWTSTAVGTGQWHRIEIGMTVGSTIEVKIYSGANLNSTTASQSSGTQDNTNTTATNVDNVRWGLISADATLDFYLDRVRGDSATAPEPHNAVFDGDVTSVPATASLLAPVPAVSVEQVVSGGGPATGTFDALAPTVTGNATGNVSSPDATFTALAHVPVVEGEINNAILGTSSSTAPNVTVTATGELTVYGVAAVSAPRPTVDTEGASVSVRYSPPVYERPMPTTERVLSFYRLTYADSIVRQGESFVSVRSPSPDMLEGLVEGVDWFRGGGVYDLSPAQVAELVSAGFPSSV